MKSPAEFVVSTIRQLFLPVLLLASTVCPAAVSFVQQNNAVPQTAQTSVPVTYTLAQVAGDTNVVAVGWNDATTSPTSVTDTMGNVYALVIGPTRQGTIHSQSIYVAKNVAAAAANANTVTVFFNAAAPYADIRILSYRGLDTTSPVDGSAGAAGTGTSLSSGTLTTTNANDLLVAASYVSTHVTAAGSGFTSRVITYPNGDIAEDQIVATVGSYSGTATMASGNWVMQMVALKAAGSLPAAAAPTFTPAPGTYTSTQTVRLADTTSGATIYYTIDGSTPTTSSAVYNDATPIQVAASTTIKAMAAASGFTNSAVSVGSYTISTSTVPIAFVQGNYAVPQTSQSSVPVTFTSAQTAGNTNVVAIGWSDSTSTINSVNDSKGNSYSLAIGPTRQSGIQSLAIYVASNIAAATAGTNTVTVGFSASVPWADVRVLEYSGLASSSPLDGTVGAFGNGTTSNSGSITTTNANDLLFAANYVTSRTNAAGAGFTSRMITNPDGDIAEDQVVSATGSYNATAAMNSGNWVMQLIALKGASGGGGGAAATPTFNPVAGTYTSAQTVHILDATAGATIYYTLNGTTPTTSSPVYNDASPIQVSTTTTIKAIAAAAGLTNSAVATGTFTIQQGTAATPTFNPAAGTYTSAQTVHLLDATSGATIYYTLDGSTPTTSSTVYNDALPIQVVTTTTIKAIAAAAGLSTSAVATGTFTIQLGTTATPTFNPAPGTYATTQSVHLLDATPGATIYYTLNGSTPTTSSTVYNDASPIQVSTSTTIKAMAAAPGFANSAVATGNYAIGASVPIGFVQIAYAVPSTPQSTVSVAYPNAQITGNTNVVAIGWSNSTSSVTSVTDTKGNSYSLAVGPTVLSGVESQVIYVGKNIVGAAAGGNSVTVKFSTAVPFPDVRILEYKGLDPVTPVDAVAGASGNSILSSSGPLTTTNAYDLLFAANYVTTSTDTAGSGFVNRVITSPDGDIAEDQIVTTTGTYTGTAPLNSSGGWVMQTVALRGAGAPPSTDPAVVGQWSGITSWPILPIHVSLMPTGKVLAWGHDATNNTTSATIWTPSTGTFQSTSFSGGDLFCAGHALLPDGRVFVAGGHNMADYHGITNGTIFNPTTLAWSSAAPMTYGRWYPTVTALPDGRMLVSSGSINCDGCNATVPEIYDPKTNTWTKLTTASLNIPIYPHMFVLPDGRVINSGSYELPIPTRALNISTQAWTTIDSTVLDAGSAVMYTPGKILKSGTSASSDPPYKNSASTAYVLDMTQGSPAWRTINSMTFARTYHNSTVLPDGNVLITGGEGTTNPFDQSTAVYAAEMWSPVSENFTTMASMQTPRVYHSTALLLPDGRVLVGGSGEYGSGSIDQLNAEIYSPPYLFKGARPTVTSAPASLTYGSQFSVQTPDASSISSVALLRLGSVTHAFNENQRYVPLTFSQSVGALTVTAPANGNIAPPGHYMLFLVNSNGVPSVGAIVQFPAP